ncbi:hypothetical protein KCP77_05425 [Salmonella enterica subsp. enterica]|nr:hypothetical protein KCP77_05425 [Salmonella enterica subsp. enterica]
MAFLSTACAGVFCSRLTCGAVPWCHVMVIVSCSQMNFGHAFPVHVHARTKTLDHRQCHGITARRFLAELCRGFLPENEAGSAFLRRRHTAEYIRRRMQM